MFLQMFQLGMGSQVSRSMPVLQPWLLLLSLPYKPFARGQPIDTATLGHHRLYLSGDRQRTRGIRVDLLSTCGCSCHTTTQEA